MLFALSQTYTLITPRRSYRLFGQRSNKINIVWTDFYRLTWLTKTTLCSDRCSGYTPKSVVNQTRRINNNVHITHVHRAIALLNNCNNICDNPTTVKFYCFAELPAAACPAGFKFFILGSGLTRILRLWTLMDYYVQCT